MKNVLIKKILKYIEIHKIDTRAVKLFYFYSDIFSCLTPLRLGIFIFLNNTLFYLVVKYVFKKQVGSPRKNTIKYGFYNKIHFNAKIEKISSNFQLTVKINHLKKS